MDEKEKKAFVNYIRDPEHSYSWECECGANFPVAENRISDDELRCPACGKEWNYKKEKEDV